MSSSTEPFSEDQVFDALSSGRRRYVIHYLRSQNEEVELAELARQVAAWEYDTDPSELTDQQEKRVYVSLYQTHIPKLAEFGIVDHDEERGIVSLASQSRTLDAYLDPTDRQEVPWQYVYLALAVAGATTLGLALLSGGTLAGIEATLLGVLFSVAFAVTAVIQIAYQRYADRDASDAVRPRD